VCSAAGSGPLVTGGACPARPCSPTTGTPAARSAVASERPARPAPRMKTRSIAGAARTEPVTGFDRAPLGRDARDVGAPAVGLGATLRRSQQLLGRARLPQQRQRGLHRAVAVGGP